MAKNVISVQATRAELRRVLRQIPAESKGRASQAMLVRVGMTALSLIREAFVVKARGGTDAAGLKWKPLSPKTVAYSRPHPGLPPPHVRAAKAPSYALSKEGREKWWKDYAQQLAIHKGDKGHAAAVAWRIAKDSGETTLLQQYGNAPHEILRDTGLLLNSLTPGVASRDQVFRLEEGAVVIGTNRKWAAVHHHGSRNGRIPKRPLWPDPKRWPSSWWLEILEQAKQALVEITLDLLRRR